MHQLTTLLLHNQINTKTNNHDYELIYHCTLYKQVVYVRFAAYRQLEAHKTAHYYDDDNDTLDFVQMPKFRSLVYLDIVNCLTTLSLLGIVSYLTVHSTLIKLSDCQGFYTHCINRNTDPSSFPKSVQSNQRLIDFYDDYVTYFSHIQNISDRESITVIFKEDTANKDNSLENKTVDNLIIKAVYYLLYILTAIEEEDDEALDQQTNSSRISFESPLANIDKENPSDINTTNNLFKASHLATDGNNNYYSRKIKSNLQRKGEINAWHIDWFSLDQLVLFVYLFIATCFSFIATLIRRRRLIIVSVLLHLILFIQLFSLLAYDDRNFTPAAFKNGYTFIQYGLLYTEYSTLNLGLKIGLLLLWPIHYIVLLIYFGLLRYQPFYDALNSRISK